MGVGVRGVFKSIQSEDVFSKREEYKEKKVFLGCVLVV